MTHTLLLKPSCIDMQIACGGSAATHTHTSYTHEMTYVRISRIAMSYGQIVQ